MGRPNKIRLRFQADDRSTLTKEKYISEGIEICVKQGMRSPAINTDVIYQDGGRWTREIIFLEELTVLEGSISSPQGGFTTVGKFPTAVIPKKEQ